MTKKKRNRARRDERQSRRFEVGSCGLWTSVSPAQRPGQQLSVEGNAKVGVRGTLDEPIRDVRDVAIAVYPADVPLTGPPEGPACIGYINHFRPQVDAAVFIAHRDFDRVWALAVGGELKHGFISFTKPRYTSAAILSLSFSNEPIE